MIMLWRSEEFLHKEGGVVGNYHLLEEAPQHLSAAIHSFCVIKRAQLLELRQKVCCTLNRSCDQLREEADEGKERKDVVCRFYLALIYIDGVTQSLESVEGDAHGKHKVQHRPVGCNAEPIHHFLKTVGKEVVVLIHSKDTQVQNDIANSDSLLSLLTFTHIHPDATGITAKGGKGNQKQEFIVPPTIENVAYNDHQ